MQESAGGKKRLDRVDWMYAAPLRRLSGVSDEVESFLLGKNKVEELLREQDTMGVLKEDNSAFISTTNTLSVSKDVAAKVREDPMLLIKKEQQAALAAIRSNPQRLRALQAARRDAEHERSSHRRSYDNGDNNVHFIGMKIEAIEAAIIVVARVRDM